MTATTRWIALFPGQGSQDVGMGQELAAAYPEAAEVFRAADDILGEPLSRLCFAGPQDDLRLTRNTQPALLTVSTAAWRVLAPHVPPPVAAAGHSLGEFSALVAAGVLDFADALRAVRLRGEAMQAAVPVGEGAMAAVIGLDAEAVERLCDSTREVGEVLVPANFNAPDQIVVAGHAAAVQRLVDRAPASGAKKALPLPVSAPFHCALMAPAAERLGAFLDGLEFRAPRFPVIANADAQDVTSGDAARERLKMQVASPVRWVASMGRAQDVHGALTGVEIGPGRVLAGLARRISERFSVLSFAKPAALESVIAALHAGDAP